MHLRPIVALLASTAVAFSADELPEFLRGSESKKTIIPEAQKPGTVANSIMRNNYPERYVLLLKEAMRSFQGRDFVGALRYADQADDLAPHTPAILNVRAAVAIEQRDFEKGKALCDQALKIEPKFYPARFNLCEIPFLQKNYSLARTMWEDLLAEVGKDELLTYRIFLTHLLEKNDEAAKEWIAKIPFPSQTPSYQYAHAAWEFAHGNKAEGEDWVRSAEYIWPAVKRADFTDVLTQLGWLKADSVPESDLLKPAPAAEVAPIAAPQ